MSTDNKEFFDLLNSISNEQTFTLQLAPREEPKSVKCKNLTTIQLKELIKSAVDSPITQSVFNSTVNKIFKQSLAEPNKEPLTVLDRLLFIIETRINSLSPKMKYKTEQDNKEIEVDIDFESVKLSLYNALESNKDLFKSQTAVDGKVTITFGTPLLDTEQQLNDELYKNADPNEAVIGYIEKYKKVVDECMRIDGIAIPIDSTIFSVR